MENENKASDESMELSSTQMYIVLGIVAVIALVGGFYFLRSKSSSSGTTASAPPAAQLQPTPTPGPITKLGCDSQYYNPVVGLPKYFLSVGGKDIDPAKSVDCTFTVSVGGKVTATTSAKSEDMTAVPSRGGNTFRCTTQGVQVEKNIPTKVDVVLKDDQNATSTCSANFSFP